MAFILSFLLPILMFLITLPIKTGIASLKSRITIANGKKKKLTKGVKKPLVSSKFKLKDKIFHNKKKSKLDKKLFSLDKRIKLMKLALKALQAIKQFFSLLKSVILLLVTLLDVVTLCILLSAILIVVLLVCVLDANKNDLDNASSTEAVSNGSGDTSNQGAGDTSPIKGDNSSWLASCATMASWYGTNINTYCTKNPPGNPKIDGRKGYQCDLLGGKTVGDDCSSLVTACLAYAGYFTGYSGVASAPSSGSFINGTGATLCTNAGFVRHDTTSTEELQAGDIMVKNGHVEIFFGIDKDSNHTLVYSWGAIYPEQPFKTTAPSKYWKRYPYYWRLEK